MSLLSTKLTVMVADDHPMICSGVTSALKSQEIIKKIDEANNGDQVFRLLSKEPYDVILMDVRMSPSNGIELTKMVKNKFPHTKVIGFSSFDEEWSVIQMIHAGASGYVLKNANVSELVYALQMVAQNKTYFSKEVTAIAGKAKQEDKAYKRDKHEETLRQIAFLIAHGKTSEQIASILSLAKRTIDTYRLELNDRTESKNIAGIIKYANQTGITVDANLKIKFSDDVL